LEQSGDVRFGPDPGHAKRCKRLDTLASMNWPNSARDLLSGFGAKNDNGRGYDVRGRHDPVHREQCKQSCETVLHYGSRHWFECLTDRLSMRSTPSRTKTCCEPILVAEIVRVGEY
jgi:hypothetical protein